MAPSKRVPAYARIEGYLRSLIIAGGGRQAPLPSEPELAKRFRVSRMTVRQAFARLVTSGMVIRYPRRGSFVNEHLLDELPITGSIGLADWPSEKGDYRRKILRYDVRKAPAGVAARFGLEPAGRVTFLRRLRIIDDRVYCLDVRYMPAAVFRKISARQIERNHLLTLLPAHGFPIGEAAVEIEIHRASAKEARLLEIGIGDPVLERRVEFADGRGALVAYGTSLYPAERFNYRLRVHSVRG